jgi:predicted Zn-dependent peptidase
MPEKVINSVSKTVLENGVRIVTEYMPHIRSISVGIWIIVGSRDEDATNNGISHVIEHMVFKGTTSRSAVEIAESLERVGGHLDAFTSKEVTCYSAHVLDEHLELAVDVLTDLVQNPTFPEEEFDKEKSVILREIQHTLETPDDLVFEYFYQDIYPAHSLGLQISGTDESVSKISLDQVHDFVNQHYVPGRVVIAAAGNVQHAELVSLVQKYLKLTAKNNSRLILKPDWPGKSTHLYHSAGNQTHCCLGFPGIAYCDPKKYALLLLNTYLGGGMSSRLFQVVREKYGLAYSIFSFLDFYDDTGIFGIYTAVLPENVEQTIELIQQELKLLTDTHLQDIDFQRIKSQLKGNLVLSLENSGSRMGRMANMEIYLQKYIGLDEVIDSINQTTLQEVRSVATELIHPDTPILTVLATHNDID